MKELPASSDTAKSSTVDGMSEDGLGAPYLFWRRRRYIVAILAFFGFFGVYMLRVNLSVAIVAMGAERNVTLENGTVITKKEFDWDSKTHGFILSSFFYGYIVTQVLGAWLGNRFGGHMVYAVGVGATAFFTVLTPPLARLGLGYLIAVRILEGLFEGVTYPCMHTVWGRWAPPLERTQLVNLAASGSYVGTVISLPLSGFLAEKFGWESVFYVCGAIVLIWLAFWCWIVKSSPEDDPYITEQELKYIQDSLCTENSQKQVKHPWKKFLTSLPVWAIIFAHFSENWGFYTLLTQLPTFMRDVLHYEVEKGGIMSALPYLVMAIIMQISSRLADWLRRNDILATVTVRKLFNCGGFIGQTAFMLLAAFVLTPTGTIVGLTIAVGLGGFALSGYFVNHLDIAPQHAGILMGLSNTIATLPGIISPQVTGFIVQNQDAREWQIIFYIASAIYLFGAVFYGLFASGEVQSWAIEEEPKQTREEHCHTNTAMDSETA